MSLNTDLPDKTAGSADLLPLYDPKGLATLTSVLEEDQVLAIIDACLADARTKTDLIVHAADVSNWSEVGNYAHDVKSTAGQIGAVRLQNLAMRLEASCRDGVGSEGPELVAAFKEMVQLTCATFQADGLPKMIALAKAAEDRDPVGLDDIKT